MEVAAARGGLLGQQSVESPAHLHHAIVLTQVVLRLRQEGVLFAIAPD